MQRLNTDHELPKTAAPPPELFRAELSAGLRWESRVLCIHPSAVVSGTVRSASVVAEDFPGMDLRVIDTRTVAAPLATLVRLAIAWEEAGHSADAIEASLQSMIQVARSISWSPP